MHRGTRLSAMALLTSLGAMGAQAASFDCRQAKTPLERAICGAPALSRLDEQLAQSYQRALGALSPSGAAALKSSQRAWLRYLPRVCSPGQPAGAEGCLIKEWESRLLALNQAGLKLGSRVLNRLDDYSTLPAPPNDHDGSAPGMVSHHVARLAIDAPRTPAEQRWNLDQKSTDPPPVPSDSFGDETTDIDVSIELGCASERLLSQETTSYQYVHGTAHGQWAVAASTSMLEADLRPLNAADLFVSGADWQRKLPTMFWRSFRTRADAPSDAQAQAELRGVISAVATDPSRWLITPAGLRINFSAYEGSSYTGTPGPITVSWAELKPLLIDGTPPRCDFSALRPG